MRAAGTFEVVLKPQPLAHADEAGLLGRRTVDKRFHGDLEGSSRGEMLSAGTPTKGSAGYVAIERVEGTLHGHKGTFVLQHSGTMDRGAARLDCTVVPDSGTGDLTGLRGAVTIVVADGKHSYTFEYEIDRAST